MAKYRAIISIEFDQDDLEEFAEQIGVDPERIEGMETINGCMDDLPFGCAWIEQFFIDERPQITRLSSGLNVTINAHS